MMAALGGLRDPRVALLCGTVLRTLIRETEGLPEGR
jgi:hypothetical protein